MTPETKNPVMTPPRVSSALIGFHRLDAGQSAAQNMDRDLRLCFVVIVVNVRDEIDDHRFSQDRHLVTVKE
jgi:hypothetical protein